MNQKFWIPGKLPGLNEMISDAKVMRKGKGGWSKYNSVKKSWSQQIGWAINQASIKAVKAARFYFLWSEQDRRRDPDNVAAGGRKIILDALVEHGVIPGDSRRYVFGWNDEFTVDKKNPGVEVTIYEETSDHR